MAIQFPCPSCAQPIEVDDEVAGREAACPYCQRVVTAPQQSTYAPRPFVEARPVGAPAGDAWAPPPPPVRGASESPPPVFSERSGLHIGAAPPSNKAAGTYGNYALISAGLVLVAFAAAVGLSVVALGPLLRQQASGGEAPTMDAIQKAMLASPHAGWIAALHVGAAFFSLVGTAFAAGSLRAKATGNPRGWIALLVCAPMLLCFCGGQLLSLIRGAA